MNKGYDFVREVASLLREKGLTVKVVSFKTTDQNAYEKQIPFKEDVLIATEIWGKYRDGEFCETARRTKIAGYKMEDHIYNKIRETVYFVNYMGGCGKYQAFTFVGIWENENWFKGVG